MIQHRAVPNKDSDANKTKLGPDATSLMETAFRVLAFWRNVLHHSERNDRAVHFALVRKSFRFTRDTSLRMSVGEVKALVCLISPDIGMDWPSRRSDRRYFP